MRAITLIGLILLAAIASAWVLLPEAFPDFRQRPDSVATTAAAPPPTARSAPAATSSSTVVTAPAPVAPVIPAARPPRFDVARIGARGTLVTAGRAEPGAEVTLTEGGRELGRARADARGEWVILPADPLAPGVRELALSARLAGQDPVPGAETVVLLVPERPSAPNATTEQMAATAPPATPTMAPATAMAPADSNLAHASVKQSASAQESSAGAAADLLSPTSPLAILLPSANAANATPRLLQAPAVAQSRLGVDVVDYDDAGAMRFAGSASPGSTVRLYVGADLLGDAEADSTGRWSLTPSRQPGQGRHTLRADQISPDGAVFARVEVPFQRDIVLQDQLRDGRMVVQPGHSLWRISRNTYGRGVRYTVIYQANRDQIRDPALIYPGQVFTLPTPGR